MLTGKKKNITVRCILRYSLLLYLYIIQEFIHEVVPCLFFRIYGSYALFNLAHMWNLVFLV